MKFKMKPNYGNSEVSCPRRFGSYASIIVSVHFTLYDKLDINLNVHFKSKNEEEKKQRRILHVQVLTLVGV